jgi:aryl-alcohol dehydrogenase-like predicted oxidoreductase
MRRAHLVHPISDLQIEYSLISRDLETAILPAARTLEIGITAYGYSRAACSAARGRRSGHWRAATSATRGHDSRARTSNITSHWWKCCEGSRERKAASVAQLAIAWVLSRDAGIVPLVGARRRDRLADALGAVDLTLTADDLARLEAAVPPHAAAGTRYDARQMQMLDSERKPK